MKHVPGARRAGSVSQAELLGLLSCWIHSTDGYMADIRTSWATSGDDESLESARASPENVQGFAQSNQVSVLRYPRGAPMPAGSVSRSPACITIVSTTCLAMASDAVAAGEGTLQT
jgi:hypothetical protein